METVYVLQNQSFWEQALPVFAGAIAAFILSVAAFYIRNNISERSQKKRLLENLVRELRYDISVIEEMNKEFSTAITKIVSGDKDPYIKYNYGKFVTNFVGQAYNAGFLFSILSEYEISVFDELMGHYANGGKEAWLRSQIEKLDQGTIKKKDAAASFQYEISDFESHIRVINDVISKIESFKSRKSQ